MKSTGIVRRIDNLGRIVIPMELRRTLNISEKDSLAIFVDGERVILRKHEPACVFCGEANNVIDFKGKKVCKQCFNELNK
ncbi:AbrB/MazE/SpoVT family DNA-binding domain-containing protein [Clostridium botulinum]|uniref:AbrB/MazE/SpoVT family DNA-binding domain-containing protein n=1 Tax=Clostridium botulinum TaxID=1491 RepID=UPI0013F057F0|nr:AbrB/MazE/SpoVT family DNA-binding domain-containing protein [Clostridium botulinum]MBN3421732.1 AbrB family transcriptional regulator [Clostridium botulinum]NEZ80364.1 AbrB/MazE/SpoVT family DNA-binding domain-containing protein [Clostridium botulinum]NFA17676.1 AbrB/MazE/SpoVT family DNA-binding domain-containing protein [Clostridium botulinum]NFA54306.1 AbrB/MazE/SpoVT family DNA-binding domain-containing protein [Clostridium botulinum]NFA67878.1 AbrB/MazE/SpoVT family DNA-binding domain